MGMTKKERVDRVKACIKDLLPLLDEARLIIGQHGMEAATLDVQSIIYEDHAETIAERIYVTDVVRTDPDDDDTYSVIYDWLRDEWMAPDVD